MYQKGFSTWLVLGIVGGLLITGGLGYWYFSSGNTTQQNGSQEPEITASEQNSSSTTSTVKYEKTETFVASSSVSTYEPGVKTTITVAPEKLPEAVQFKSFTYNQTVGKTITVSGSCKDSYFTIVMFRSTDDYKKNPASAVFNQAFPCPTNHSFSQSIDVKNSNIPSGHYYFFVADQGNTGLWYNPR